MSDINVALEGVKKWYYCFKVRGGKWVASGPFESNDEAARARENSKAPGFPQVEVGNVFFGSKEEADERCASELTG